MAAASFGPDISSNMKVAIKDCETKATVFGHLKVNIKVVNSLGFKEGFASGKLLVTHQKVKPDSCIADVEVWKDINWLADSNGLYTYTEETEFIHNNKEDLFRVQVLTFSLLGPQSGSMSDVQVLKYSQSECNFMMRTPPLIYNP